MVPKSMPEVEANETNNNGHAVSAKGHKVVINLGSGAVVKGYVACGADPDPTALFENTEVREIQVQLLETDEWASIPISEVKAIFFVKSFRGDSKRKALRFYTNGPDMGQIWAEIRFNDNEVLEGKVDNTVRHLVGDGFLVHPTDSGGNNVLMYVNKKAVQSYRVLGVRANRKAADRGQSTR
jgi:hypothetical protein